MDTLYTAIAHAVNGRNGHVRTSDGVIDFDLTLPKSMGGLGAADTTNPEQLFASGYAACFGSAIDLVAKQKKITVGEIHVTAEVSIGSRAEGGFGLAVVLQARLPDVKREDALALVEAAHQICPYSNAIRGNVEVKLDVVEE